MQSPVEPMKALPSYHELTEALDEEGGQHMNKGFSKVTFPNACQLMRWHFHPMGFEASMDAPGSMIARLFDRASGETMIAIAGIPCATVMNAADVERIIEAVEDELESFIPPAALRSYA
ncbi:DUF1652 domain-containing protein [Pseudomonas sp. IT-P100]